VGNYAFVEPFVPSLEEVEDAEKFIFGLPASLALSEEHRRRNVIKLAIASAAEDWMVAEEEAQAVTHNVKLIGGGIVQILATRHDGNVVRDFTFVDDEGV
jgi:hypothetical protein